MWGYVSFWGPELPGHVLYSEPPSSALIRVKEAGFRDSQSTGYSSKIVHICLQDIHQETLHSKAWRIV